MSDFDAITGGTNNAVDDGGYSETITQENDGSYFVTLERHLVGPDGEGGFELRAYGHGSDQAAAETQALAALNAQRAYRYAGSSSIPQHSGLGAANDSFTGANGPDEVGEPLTEDVS